MYEPRDYTHTHFAFHNYAYTHIWSNITTPGSQGWGTHTTYACQLTL